jgi:hypothetical protein
MHSNNLTDNSNINRFFTTYTDFIDNFNLLMSSRISWQIRTRSARKRLITDTSINKYIDDENLHRDDRNSSIIDRTQSQNIGTRFEQKIFGETQMTIIVPPTILLYNQEQCRELSEISIMTNGPIENNESLWIDVAGVRT